jgi:hypothetical protein
MTDTKLYLIETVSMFRMRYVVEAQSEEHAMDEVTMHASGSDNELREFSQHHIDEVISSGRELSQKQYMKLFDKDNDYLKSWTDEQKLEFINKIDYND